MKFKLELEMHPLWVLFMIVLSILKLIGAIHISWIWIVSPLWFPLAVIQVILNLKFIPLLFEEVTRRLR